MTVRILTGDCRERLQELPDGSVQCCVTSPPYFGLRDYDVDGQIGLESTPDAYVAELVAVFREVWRALADDGTLWLNLGDTYAGGGHLVADKDRALRKGSRGCVGGLKPKDLIGIPWRVALALQADGWWLRSCNIWAKPNGMPESTRDRPTVAHEYVFQLAKSERYYYGEEDLKLPPVPESVERLGRAMRSALDAGPFVVSGGGYAPPGQPPHKGARATDKQRGHSRRHAGFNDRWDALSRAEQQAKGAALRSVWWIAPAGYSGAHFAVMPDELAAVMVLAGCPRGGTVLDPFGGAATTGLVADRLGRNAVLVELNPDYAAMAERRIAGDAGMFAALEVA